MKKFIYNYTVQKSVQNIIFKIQFLKMYILLNF